MAGITQARANPFVRLAVLLVATLAMGIASSFPVAVTLRLIRLWRIGTPMSAKMVAGAPLDPLAAALCVAAAVLSLAAVGWGYARLASWLDGRRSAEFERNHALRRLALGMIIGAAVMIVSVGAMVVAGAASISPGQEFALSSSTIAPVLVVPVLEELVFRGIILRVLDEAYGAVVALVASSTLFGLAHLLNDHATLLAASCVAVGLGGLLGVAYLVTRSLWLPIGLHAGWNFAEGDILGAPDSGNAVHGVFETVMTGHTLITGGAFGPEASLVTLAFAAIATGALYHFARAPESAGVG